MIYIAIIFIPEFAQAGCLHFGRAVRKQRKSSKKRAFFHARAVVQVKLLVRTGWTFTALIKRKVVFCFPVSVSNIGVWNTLSLSLTCTQ